MPIKKLAQLILAIEGFLLLTAIVVSTSYQLSRKSSVTETRSRAQAADTEAPWGYLEATSQGTRISITAKGWDDTKVKNVIVLFHKVGVVQSQDHVINETTDTSEYTKTVVKETAGLEPGQYEVWMNLWDPYVTGGSVDDKNHMCEGGFQTALPRCNRKHSAKQDHLTFTLPLGSGAKPRCNAFSLTLPAGKTSVLKTDPISIAINAKAAETGSALFANSRPIVLSALKQPAGTAHDFLDYGGEPSHCEGKATCVKADRGFTFEHAGITEAGEYKIYPYMANNAGGTCTDKPGTPAANQCGCQPVAVTLVAQPAAGPTCASLTLNKTTVGEEETVTATLRLSSGQGNYKNNGVILHAATAAELGQNNQHYMPITYFDGKTGEQTTTFSFVPKNFNVKKGVNIVWLTIENSNNQACTDRPAEYPVGRPNWPLCGCGAKQLTVSSSPVAVSPTCTSLTLNPSSPATRETPITATIKVSSGSSLFAAGKIALHSLVSSDAQRDLGTLSTCDPTSGCSFPAFTPRVKEMKTGIHQVWISLENGDGLKCTDKPGLRQPTDPPACGCGPTNLVVPADAVGCGSFKMLKNDAELTDPIKIRSGEALILRAAPNFLTDVRMQGAIFASISKSLSASTLRVLGVFVGSGIPYVNWTVGDLALGEYYLFAVPVGLQGSTPVACSPFQLPFDLSGLQGMDPINLRSIVQCPNCKKLVEVVTTPLPPTPTGDVSLKLRDEGNRIFPTSGFVCGTSAANNTQPLEFNLVATYPVEATDRLKNGVDRVELRYRMQGTGTWKGIGFHQCTKVWDNTKKTLVGPAECRLYNMDWWRWLPREFYQGDNLYEFKASAYSPNVGLYKEVVVPGVKCTGPTAQPRPPATVGDPKCDSFELSATQVTVNTPVRVDVRARCAGGACTDLAKEGIRDFNFFQKKGEAPWLWMGSRSCYLSWPLHGVCFTGAYLKKDHCKTSDTDCDASAFNWVPTTVGTYQLQARVSNNAGRQVLCPPATITVNPAGGAVAPLTFWQKLVASWQSWFRSLVPAAWAQEATAPLKVIFKLEDAPQSLLGRVVTVSLLSLEESYNLVAVPRGEGIYEATINLPASAVGPARVGVKPAGYLQRVKEATLVVGQTVTVDFGETEFLGGDLNDDNKLTIADLAEELLPQFSETNELSVQLNDDNRFMDLNDDGIINVLDISIVLKNLTELEVRGEE